MSTRQALQRYGLDLLGGWLQEAKRVGWLRLHEDDGATTWPEELRALFAQHINGFAGDYAPDQATNKAQAWARLVAALHDHAGHDVAAERWLDLLDRHRLTPLQGQLLAWVVALSADLPLLRAWRFGWSNLMRDALTLGFAQRVLADDTTSDADLLAAFDPSLSKPFTLRWLSTFAPSPDTLHPEHSVVLPPTTRAWLCGAPCDDPARRPFDRIRPTPARLRPMLTARLRAMPKPTPAAPLRAVIVGPRGSGRLSVAAQLALSAGVRDGLWLLNLPSPSPTQPPPSPDTLARLCDDALRMASLCDAALVIRGLHPALPLPTAASQALHRAPLPLIWVSESELPLSLTGERALTLSISYPTREERLTLWQIAYTPPLDDPTCQRLAASFLLTEGQIRHLSASAAAPPEPTADDLRARSEQLFSSARAASLHGLGQLAAPQSGPIHLSHLLVSPETQTALQEIISYARHKDTLQSLFSSQHAYGLGVTCLFCGPPGTGKTLAAQAIAAHLDREVYRVDVSQLVSKYIGETEKHLDALFTAAEAGDILLLFDEADSLFAKRMEVKSSTDRYANLEVNYLLQRTEQSKGLIILTTNFESAIDDAFTRRIRFKVAFERPDVATRRRLWSLLLPPGVPLGPSVDLDFLAESFDLSGGEIKNVTLRAASIALEGEERGLSQALLLRCANAEYKNMGKLPLSGPTRARA